MEIKIIRIVSFTHILKHTTVRMDTQKGNVRAGKTGAISRNNGFETWHVASVANVKDTTHEFLDWDFPQVGLKIFQSPIPVSDRIDPVCEAAAASAEFPCLKSITGFIIPLQEHWVIFKKPVHVRYRLVVRDAAGTNAGCKVLTVVAERRATDWRRGETTQLRARGQGGRVATTERANGDVALRSGTKTTR